MSGKSFANRVGIKAHAVGVLRREAIADKCDKREARRGGKKVSFGGVSRVALRASATRLNKLISLFAWQQVLAILPLQLAILSLCTNTYRTIWDGFYSENNNGFSNPVAQRCRDVVRQLLAYSVFTTHQTCLITIYSIPCLIGVSTLRISTPLTSLHKTKWRVFTTRGS